MKARIEATDDGGVTMAVPTTAGGGFSATLSADQAETMAHALLIQAYVARGNTPTTNTFARVREWRLR